jgi:hypothetical protein
MQILDLKTLIPQVAGVINLPVPLVAAVVDKESGGDPFASRYEPAFFERYIRKATNIKARAPCSLETERQFQATSWGLMQVMGATARSLGFPGPFLSALCDPAASLLWGCTLLHRLRDRYLATYGWPGVVAAYNAGSPRLTTAGKFENQDYVNDIVKRLGGVWPS